MKVLFQGTFDMFHWMHLESIRQAKAEGDHLLVLVNSDKLVEVYKNKKPVFPEKYRLDIISNLKDVDEARLTDDFSPLSNLKREDIDVYVMCDEWDNTKTAEKAYMKKMKRKVVILPYIKADFMQDVKDKMKANIEKKEAILCEDCHRKI